MSQSAKNKILAVVSTQGAAPIIFQSEVGLFLLYLLVRTLPIVAIVFYFTTVLATLLTMLGLIILLLWAARRYNHRFTLYSKHLEITPSFWPLSRLNSYPYTSIVQATIKMASQRDKRQWISLQDCNGSQQRYRCDWLHQQDPPSVDEHDDDGPQHELFDLLNEEDFYDGSIQHLAFLLREKGISVQSIVS